MQAKDKKPLLEWIEKEKFILQSLINHHTANTAFMIFHFKEYGPSLKDWWDSWKIKRYIKKLNKLEQELKK